MSQRFAFVALISMAGCGWANPPTTVQTASHPLAGVPNATQKYLYLGLNPGTGPTLLVYPLDGSKPIRSITDSWRVAVLETDRWGDVYTADDNPSGGEMTAYTSGGRSVLFTTYAGGVSCMTFDRSGDLFACQDEYVQEYAPRSGKRMRPGRDAQNVWSIAVDRAGNVYAAQLIGGGSESKGAVKVFHPHAQQPFRTIHVGVNNPTSLAIDSSGNLYVANCPGCWMEKGTGSVSEYAPGSDTPMRVLRRGINDPTWLLVGPHDELYVANDSTYSTTGPKPDANLRFRAWITIYNPSGDSPEHRISDHFTIVWGMTLDAQGNLYALSGIEGKTESVVVYNQRYALVRTITDGVKSADAIAIGP